MLVHRAGSSLCAGGRGRDVAASFCTSRLVLGDSPAKWRVRVFTAGEEGVQCEPEANDCVDLRGFEASVPEVSEVSEVGRLAGERNRSGWRERLSGSSRWFFS
eukprot:571985-Hanusia_phi.AAC.3